MMMSERNLLRRLMQTAFSFFDITKVSNKTIDKNSIVLTERDLEIISFIHEMKFASLDDLHFKFFKLLKDGTESKSQWWARERLSALVKAHYISRIYSFSERKSFYLGSEKGYWTLLNHCPSKLPVKPLEKIDFNTFSHDKLVLKIRLELEKTGQASHWLSDRKLFQYPELCTNLGEGNQPDAIYTSPNMAKVAFELEISRKSKKRYHDKIRTYAYLLREKRGTQPFNKVHFIVANETVRDLLAEETKIYPQIFKIQLLTDFIMEELC